MNYKSEKGNIKLIILLVVIFMILLALIIGIVMKNKTSENVSDEIEYNYLALYDKDGNAGVIDKAGNKIIDIKYSTIYIPNQAKDVFFCYDEEGNYSVLNANGEDLFSDYENVYPLNISYSSDEMEKDVLEYEKDGKYGLLSISGDVVTDAIYDKVQSLTNKPGFILVQKDDKVGVLDSTGKEIIPLEYNSIVGDNFCSEEDQYSKSGYIVSQKKEDGIYYGYINYKGKVKVKTIYEYLERDIEYDDDNVYLTFMTNGKKGVLKNYKEIIAPKFQSIIYYNSSNIFAVCKNNKYGFYDISGNEILETLYTEYSVAGNYISVKKDDEMILYDIHGNQVNRNIYKSIIETNNPSYFIAVDENNHYSIISKDTTIENNYTNITYAFDNFFIFTTEEGLSGILDLYSGIEVEAKYDSILLFEHINALEAKKGETVDIYSRKIEKIASIDNAIVESIGNDYASVYSNNDLIYLNKEGELVSNTEVYSELKFYSYKDDNDKWGFKDVSGQVIVEAIYDKVTELNEFGYAGIYKDGKWGIIDENGKVIVEPTYTIETYYNPTFLGTYQVIISEDAYCIEL